MVLSLNNKKSHKIILQNIDFMTFFIQLSINNI